MRIRETRKQLPETPCETIKERFHGCEGPVVGMKDPNVYGRGMK